MPCCNFVTASIVMISLSPPSFGQAPALVGASKAEEFVLFGVNFFKAIKSKPTHQKVKKVKNQYGESKPDEWHTDTYSGFRVEFLRAASAPYDLLSNLTISDPSIKLPFGISIGNTKSQIIQVLGQPTSQKKNELEYEIGDIQTETAYFKFANDRLVQVKWSYEID